MYFFTATINSWQMLLADDMMKDIIIQSLHWHHENNRARTHGFVIMPNHLHLMWSPVNTHFEETNEWSLLSFTAHEFKKYLMKNDPGRLTPYLSTEADRQYHFWERRSRTIEVMSRSIAEQKLDYMHLNPLSGRWNLVSFPEEYRYSSAKYYMLNRSSFNFIRHYADYI
ncbi:MAG: transposase [Chitinophagales bacterium]|nr:transposase [Chitinophagales bacterium]